MEFHIEARDLHNAARRGRLTTPHGVAETPAFMPVGTAGTVKGLTPAQLRETRSQIILANTYHLALRPGAETVESLGGLHRFSAWDGPILTDSGGYQVFSLAELVKVDEDGVTFRSHVDGAALRLEPESAVAVQNQLGADLIMVLDQCPPSLAPRAEVEAATNRSLRWAARCKAAHRRPEQALLAIVQGGVHHDLRAACARSLMEIGFDGYAIGGLAVGESAEQRAEVLARLMPLLPADRPRYLMGVGRPIDILEAVAAGVDMFDCVLPTRNGRNSFVFTSRGTLRLRNACHARSREPLDPECGCYTCRHFSRGYLRHLFLAGEMLGPILASLHNLAYYQAWMARIRAAISAGTLLAWLEVERRFGWDDAAAASEEA